MSEPKIIHLPKGGGGGVLVAQDEPARAGDPVGPLGGYLATGLVPPLGWVRLQAITNGALVVVCRLNGLSPSPGIEPGWQRQPRPGRAAMTHWPGRDGFELPVGVLFRDDFKRSVEGEIDVLERLAGRDLNPQSNAQPPTIVFDTAGLSPYDAQHHPELRWVINGLQPDPVSERRNQAGHRFFAQFTVTLWVQVDDQLVPERSAALRRQRHGRLQYPRSYTVRAGDTLVSIARRQLGDPDRWHDLAHLNDIRDPHRALTVGRKLRLR